MNVDDNKVRMIKLLTEANDLNSKEKLKFIQEVLSR